MGIFLMLIAHEKERWKKRDRVPPNQWNISDLEQLAILKDQGEKEHSHTFGPERCQFLHLSSLAGDIQRNWSHLGCDRGIEEEHFCSQGTSLRWELDDLTSRIKDTSVIWLIGKGVEMLEKLIQSVINPLEMYKYKMSPWIISFALKRNGRDEKISLGTYAQP
ncbi:hypothetical protein llap_4923 [Limosa lapponica baueri]|uniref:Uncharacterized protein n=1 Tax=Limosa lapponica baueri TaxID=1758121 RepID=A0A2I0UFF8_LIMLA|nr:hypothetical protein llap_4923 [Limosa lapponica baueri]